MTNEKLEEEQMSRVSEETKLKMHIEKYKERIQKVSEDRFHIEQELTKLKHETAPLLFTVSFTSCLYYAISFHN